MQAVQLNLQSLDLVGSGFDYRAQYRVASIEIVVVGAHDRLPAAASAELVKSSTSCSSST
jgi:hypothetical protein